MAPIVPAACSRATGRGSGCTARFTGPGLATRPESTWRDDGLELTNAWLTAAVRCVPPANKPTSAEREACRPFLEREVRALAELQVIVALGGFAWDAVLRTLSGLGYGVPSPKPKFGHGAEVEIGAPPDARAAAPSAVRRDPVLLGSYHPSQQNTFTGRLTRGDVRRSVGAGGGDRRLRQRAAARRGQQGRVPFSASGTARSGPLRQCHPTGRRD